MSQAAQAVQRAVDEMKTKSDEKKERKPRVRKEKVTKPRAPRTKKTPTQAGDRLFLNAAGKDVVKRALVLFLDQKGLTDEETKTAEGVAARLKAHAAK